jgi:hypothetical protein
VNLLKGGNIKIMKLVKGGVSKGCTIKNEFNKGRLCPKKKLEKVLFTHD